jgi:hypothetical protein
MDGAPEHSLQWKDPHLRIEMWGTRFSGWDSTMLSVGG